MSLSFYLPHKKTLFSSKILSVRELLSLVPKLQTFPNNTDSQFRDSKLNEHSSLLLGIHKQSGRGFEVSFEKDLKEKDAYRIRFLTPSTQEDWKIGLSFLKELASRLKVKIISEYDDIFTAKDIEDFPFEKDILFGISAYFAPSEEPTGEPEISTYTVPGIYRPVVIDREIQKKLIDSPNPVEAFSKFYNQVQYETAYSANQKFYKNTDDQSIFGVYTLTEGVDTILPFEPFVEFKNIGSVSDKDIQNWQLSLVCHEGDPDDFDAYRTFAVVDYREFIKHLPKDAYEFIDAAYIVVFEMTKQEMQTVVEKINR